LIIDSIDDTCAEEEKAAPHLRQNFAVSALSNPQLLQDLFINLHPFPENNN
jgi:hypothetical protein